jgi:hypothetical protein
MSDHQAGQNCPTRRLSLEQDLVAKAIQLYIYKIPQQMHDAGFCAHHIEWCCRFLCIGDGADASEGEADIESEDAVPAGADDGVESSKERSNKTGDASSSEQNHQLQLPGLKFYQSWKNANDKTDKIGQYGFTSRQLRCLKDIEEEIKKLEAHPQSGTQSGKHQALREVM